MRTRAGAVALLIGLSTFLAACGDGTSSGATTLPVASPAGHTYVVTNAGGATVPDGVETALAFDATELRVTGLCNHASGTWVVDNGKLVVTQLQSTDMACQDTALMDFETTMLTFVGSSPGITLVGDVMTLTGADITLALQERAPAADLPLEGTQWTVTGTVQGDGTQSLDTEPATIRFEGGTAEVFAGCNTGSVTYTVQDDRITFGSLGLTKKACDEPAMLLEKVVSEVLAGDVTFDIETTKLSLFKKVDDATPVEGLTLTGA